MEKLDATHSAGENVKCYSPSGKQFGSSSKKSDKELPYNSAIPLLGIFPREFKTYSTQMFVANY